MSLSPIEVRIRCHKSDPTLFQVVVRVDDTDKDVWLLSDILSYTEATHLARHMQTVQWYHDENADGPFGWMPQDIPVPLPEEEGDHPS